MIRKLPDSVINLISAGEVIQRPFNVVKQLVQNSIDAGATQISVTLNHGGLKLIKISDNGKGIMLQDFPLLCARFATSKIKQFSDMSSLNSFGFRGEALASLSYVSNLSISSKWHEDAIGHSAQFKNEKLDGKITDVPLNTGTTIAASDLFSKLQSRRGSLNPSEQKKRIYRLLCHFCLHYPQIKFSLFTQKGDQNLPKSHLQTNLNECKMNIFQKITNLSYDKFSYVGSTKISNSQIQIQAIMTKINCCKGKTFMLSINNRIVQNQQLFKIVEKAYSQCYQSIHEQNQSFYVYMSLKINPKFIDCNVDPTKKSVGLFASQQLYEDIKQIIINQIKKDSAIKILKPSQSHSLKSNNEANINIKDIIREKMGGKVLNETNQKIKNQIKSKPVYAFQRNRTDSKQMPIQFYSQPVNKINQTQIDEKSTLQYRFEARQRDAEVRNFFKQCSYVGCYNLNFILIHYQNKLYMLNILQFLPSFLAAYCQTNNLAIKQIRQHLHIQDELTKFIKKTNLLHHQQVKNIISWLAVQENRQMMVRKFGVFIQGSAIKGYPCLGDVFLECISQDHTIGQEIAYLLCRVYNASIKDKLDHKLQDKFMSQFISAQFIEQNKILSPFNQKMSNLFKNKVIPILKTNPISMNRKIPIQKYLKQMLDLKDIYKIFERC